MDRPMEKLLHKNVIKMRYTPYKNIAQSRKPAVTSAWRFQAEDNMRRIAAAGGWESATTARCKNIHPI